MQDNRPAVYLEGDKVIYRASALGHCLRSLWAARCGLKAKPIPETIQKAMDEGTELESHILMLLYDEFNFSFDYNTEQFQVELIVGSWNGKTLIVRGKMDEVSGGRPVDVKAFAQSLVDEYRTKGMPMRYRWQQSVYCIGMKADMFYMPIYNKDTKKIEPWSVQPLTPPFTRDQIRDRVLQVEEAFDSNIMPTDCPGTFGCQYYYLHEAKPESDPLPDNLTQLAQSRLTLSHRIKVYTEARKALDRALTAKLSQGKSYTLDDYIIQVVANARRFNTVAAKQILTDAELDWEHDDFFWILGEGTQLRMTQKKAK